MIIETIRITAVTPSITAPLCAEFFLRTNDVIYNEKSSDTATTKGTSDGSVSTIIKHGTRTSSESITIGKIFLIRTSEFIKASHSKNESSTNKYSALTDFVEEKTTEAGQGRYFE